MLNVPPHSRSFSVAELSRVLEEIRTRLSRGQAGRWINTAYWLHDSRTPDGACERCRDVTRERASASVDERDGQTSGTQAVATDTREQADRCPLRPVCGETCTCFEDAAARASQRLRAERDMARAQRMGLPIDLYLQALVRASGLDPSRVLKEPSGVRPEGGRSDSGTPVAPPAAKETEMKNTVTIDGVQLTRGQVEAAMAELNKPEPKPITRQDFPAGTIIRTTQMPGGFKFVVVDEWTRGQMPSGVVSGNEVIAVRLDRGSICCFQPYTCSIHATDQQK